MNPIPLALHDTIFVAQQAARDGGDGYRFTTWVLGTIVAAGAIVKMLSNMMLRQSLPAIVDGIQSSQDARYVLKTDVGSTAEHKAKGEIARWWSETQRDRIEPLERDVAEIKHDHKHIVEAMRKQAEESGAMAKAIINLDKRVVRILTILRPDEAIE
jgi:hypothetical protein